MNIKAKVLYAVIPALAISFCARAWADQQQNDILLQAGQDGARRYDEKANIYRSPNLDSLFLIYKHRIMCEEISGFSVYSWDGYNVRIKVAGADTMYEEIAPYKEAADSSYYQNPSANSHEWNTLRCWERHGEQDDPYEAPYDQWIGGFANDNDTNVETKIFDLRPFAGDTIQICFVGGSDWGTCTLDSSDFFGYIIDDILLVEGLDSTRLADLPPPLGGDTLFFDDFEGPDQGWSYYSIYPIGNYWWLASGGHSGSYKAMCSDQVTMEYFALVNNAIVSPQIARDDLPEGLDSLWLDWWLKCSVDTTEAWAYNMYKLDEEDWKRISVLYPPYEGYYYSLAGVTNDQWKHNAEHDDVMYNLSPLLSMEWDTLQVSVGFVSSGAAVPPGSVGLQVDDICLVGALNEFDVQEESWASSQQSSFDTLLHFTAEGPSWNDEVTGVPWSTVDFTTSLADTMWHKDAFKAISGTYSMWWGDPAIQGYANDRYQALISPKLYIGYPPGAIAGTVSSTAKGPVAGAVVTAQGPETKGDTTDVLGQYLIAGLPAGLYDVTASASGYYSETEEDVAVADGDTALVDFSITPFMASEWIQMLPPVAPSARYGHAMASLEGDQVLLFGGFDGLYDAETWVYDLSADTWTQMLPSTSPLGRINHAMAALEEDQVLLFGGSSGGTKTWIYDLSANTWTETLLTPCPSAREDHAMASLEGNQVLLFGGNADTTDAETWVYDHNAHAWTQMFPSVRPFPRENHALASLGGDQVLMYGGVDSLGYYDGQTWVYDLGANTWTHKFPAISPSARRSHGMVSLGGGQVLLFGGYDGVDYDDTWVYDLSSNTWTQVVPAVSPSARRSHALASLEGGQALLFGGYDGAYDAETWIYTGASTEFPEAIDDLTIALENGSKSSSGDMRLVWSEPQGDVSIVRYVIYRSADPTAPGDSLAGTVDTSYLDVGAAGTVGTNYFYVVRAVDSVGHKSADSNRVGEFDRATINGTK